MDAPRIEPDPGAAMIDHILAEKRRRIGTALQQLATDLARERRRSAQLERELARLRAQRPA